MEIQHSPFYMNTSVSSFTVDEFDGWRISSIVSYNYYCLLLQSIMCLLQLKSRIDSSKSSSSKIHSSLPTLIIPSNEQNNKSTTNNNNNNELCLLNQVCCCYMSQYCGLSITNHTHTHIHTHTHTTHTHTHIHTYIHTYRLVLIEYHFVLFFYWKDIQGKIKVLQNRPLYQYRSISTYTISELDKYRRTMTNVSNNNNNNNNSIIITILSIIVEVLNTLSIVIEVYYCCIM